MFIRCLQLMKLSVMKHLVFLTFVALCILGRIKGVENGRIFRDPEILEKIPQRLRREVDQLISSTINQMLSVHFDQSGNLMPSSPISPVPDDVKDIKEGSETVIEGYDSHIRTRRDTSDCLSKCSGGGWCPDYCGVGQGCCRKGVSNPPECINATVPVNGSYACSILNIAATYGEWSEWGECSTKCGGGLKTRTRQCLEGNCTILGSYIETRGCGYLPCVSGTYVFDSINPIWNINMDGARNIKFFTLFKRVFFGYITATKMYIYFYKYQEQRFVLHQWWDVTDGISFTLLDTKMRIYIVVVEKSVTVFPGRYSRMYFYDLLSNRFDLAQPVRFEVFDPSAAIGFHVYGVPYMAIVNRRSKMMSPSGGMQKETICDGQRKRIACPSGTYISIQEVFYGRSSLYVCPSGLDFSLALAQFFSFCTVNGIKNKVVSKCDNEEYCDLTASPSELISTYDNCVQVKKYLHVTFTCSILSLLSEPLFYRWDGVGLSIVRSDNLMTYGAKDIEAFSIHNNAYVAVANYVNDQGSHHLDSEVYFYNLDKKMFQSRQTLRTDGAVDLEFFVIGRGLAREYFLAVANNIKKFPNGKSTYEVDSVIYKWNWNIFVPFQCIRTYGAKKWTAVTGENGEFVLTIVNQFGRVRFYGYDGWRFYETTVQPEGDIFLNVSGTNFINFVMQSGLPAQHLFMVHKENTTLNNTKNLFLLNFKRTFPKYELLESTMAIVQEMNRTVYQEILPRAEVFNESYNAVKNDIVFMDDVIELTGNKILENIIVNSTTVETAIVENVDLSPYDKAVQILQDNSSMEVDRCQPILDNISAILDLAVTNGTEQVILHKKTFTNVVFSVVDIFNDINVSDLINNVDLQETKNNAVLLKQNATIDGFFTFNTTIYFNGDVTVDGTINNITVNDIVTTDTMQNISGVKHFQNAVFSSGIKKCLTVAGLVDGINFTNIMLLDKEKEISTTHLYKQAYIKLLDVSGHVNGLNLTEIITDALLKTEVNPIISANKIFKKIHIDGNLSMSDFKTINDVDVSELPKNGLYLNTVNNFTEPITFNGNITFKNVVLGGDLNGKDVSDVIYTDEYTNITALYTFMENVTAYNEVVVKGLINGINIPDNVMDTFSDQEISGNKTFKNNVTVYNDLTVEVQLDSVDISALYNTSMLMGKDQMVTALKEFTELITTKVDLVKCTKDCQLIELLKNINTNTAREGNVMNVVYDLKTFTNELSLTNLNTSTLNSQSFPGILLIQGENQTIHGPVDFVNVTFTDDVRLENINGKNMNILFESVFRTVGNQTVTANFVFSEGAIFNNLSATGLIDGINLGKEVIFTNESYTILSDKLFKNFVTAEILYTYQMIVTGLIDRVNLTELERELVTLSGNKIIKGKKIFQNHVSFAGNWTILGLIDGVNLTELNNNAMRVDRSQNVTGRKIFKAPIEITNENILVEGFVDGVNLTELAQKTVKFTDPVMRFYEEITFNNLTINGDLNVDGLVNYLNLTALVEDSLLKTGNQNISGLHYVKNLTVNGDVKVSSVNGIEFLEQVVNINNVGLITGNKYFAQGFTAENITLRQNIDGLNITRFNERVAFADEDTVIISRKTFKNFNTTTLDIGGLINGVNWTLLTSTTLLKNANQTVFVPTTFQNVTFDEAIQTETINEVDIMDVSERAVYKCYGENKVITAKHTYKDAEIQNDTQIKNISLPGTVNNINVTEIAEIAVRKTGNFTIAGTKNVKTLNADSIIAKKINGYSVPDDFVQLYKQGENITAKKTFEREVNVKHNITLEAWKTVNKIDVSELALNIVTKTGNNSIISPVNISNVIISDNLECENVNSVNVSADNLLLKSGYNQSVIGVKYVDHISVITDVITQNPINGFDLKKMKNETVLIDQKNIIDGKKTIDGNVFVKGDVLVGLVDGRNVTDLFSVFTKISNFLYRDIGKFNTTIELHREITSQVSGVISDIRQRLDYFIHHEEILLNYRSLSMDAFSSIDGTWLVPAAHTNPQGNKCLNTSIFYRSNSNSSFSRHSQVISSSLTSVQFVSTDTNLYYVTASDHPSRGCYVRLDANKYYGLGYHYNTEYDRYQSGFGMEILPASHVDNKAIGETIYTMFTATNPNSTCSLQTYFVMRETENFNQVKKGKSSVTTCNVVKTIIAGFKGDLILVGILGTNTNSLRQLDIYEFDPKKVNLEQTEFVHLQSISTFYASDVLSFEMNTGRYIVIANTYDSSPGSLKVSYDVPMIVLKYDEVSGKFHKYQDIKIFAAQLVKHFSVGSYDYLAVATFDQKIVIFRHKGVSKWQRELTVPTQGYDSVKDLTLWKDTHNDLYMALLTEDFWDNVHPSKVEIVKAEFTTEVNGEDILKELQ